MKITETHVQFWQQRHRPGWVSRVDPTSHVYRITVHDCINARAGIRFEPEPHNTMQLLPRLMRREGFTLEQGLRYMIETSKLRSGWSMTKRAAYCLRWLRRVYRTKNYPG